MVEGSRCNCSHPTWKSTSHVITTKVSQIASWAPMNSLLWVQRKRRTPIILIGCVHTHRKILVIEGCSNPNHVWNIVEKDGEDN